VSYETNFVLIYPNLEPKLFQHYPKQDFCFGCFVLIWKQLISVFRYNRNIQRPFETNRNKRKMAMSMSTPMSITYIFAKKTETDRFSVYFGANQNRKIVSVFVSISMSESMSCSHLCPCPCLCPRPRSCSLHKSVVIFLFGLFQTADFLFRFVPKRFQNTETNRKKSFLVREKDRNRTETDRVSVCFVSNRNKKLFVSRPP
jgi:hypothetical protein